MAVAWTWFLRVMLLAVSLFDNFVHGLVRESSVDHHFSSVGTIEDLVKAGAIEDRSNGCYTKTDMPMHSVNDWQGNLWTSEVVEHMAKGSYVYIRFQIMSLSFIFYKYLT